jgi:hypothetical protein
LFAAVDSAGARRWLVGRQPAQVSLNAILPCGLGASNHHGQVAAPAGGSLPVPFDGTRAKTIVPLSGLLLKLPSEHRNSLRTPACPKLERVLLAAETGTFVDRKAATDQVAIVLKLRTVC